MSLPIIWSLILYNFHVKSFGRWPPAYLHIYLLSKGSLVNRRNLLAKVFPLICCITWRFQRDSIRNPDPPPEIGVQSEILAALFPVVEKTPHLSYKGQIHLSNLTLSVEMLRLPLLPFLFLLLLIGPSLFPITLILHSFLGLTFQCMVLLCLTFKI